MKRSTVFTLSVTLALTVATPTLSPNGGTFSSSVSVAMQSATSGGSIYYTTDGSTPTQSSTLYTGAMTLTSSATVKAAAFKSGYNPSAVAAASFTNSITGTTGTGKNYYVAKNGSDSNSCTQAQSQSTPKLTIAAGIACLSGGDTLNIKAGTYSESIGTAQGIAISGSSWATATTVQGFGSDVVNINPSGSRPAVGFCAGAGGTAIRYIIFKNLRMSNGVTISDCGSTGQIDHIRFDTVDIHDAPSNGSVVFLGNGGTGNFSEIINSKVHDNGSSSEHLYHGVYVIASNVLIENTEIYNISGYGIHNYEPNFRPSNNVYRNNWIHHTGRATSSSRPWGIVLMNGTNNRAYGNILSNNAEGINCASNGCLIHNNTLYANGTGYPAILVNSGFSGVVVKNNIVHGNAINSIVNNGTGVVSNNLTTDPKFLNPAANNFRLQSTSPAIDAGTSNIATGIAIPFNGSAPDIGAYEYE